MDDPLDLCFTRREGCKLPVGADAGRAMWLNVVITPSPRNGRYRMFERLFDALHAAQSRVVYLNIGIQPYAMPESLELSVRRFLRDATFLRRVKLEWRNLDLVEDNEGVEMLDCVGHAVSVVFPTKLPSTLLHFRCGGWATPAGRACVVARICKLAPWLQHMDIADVSEDVGPLIEAAEPCPHVTLTLGSFIREERVIAALTDAVMQSSTLEQLDVIMNEKPVVLPPDVVAKLHENETMAYVLK